MPGMSENGARGYAAGITIPFPRTERLLLRRLRGHGYVVTHQHVFVGKERSFVVDFFFPGLGVVLELDSIEHRRRRFVIRDQALNDLIAKIGLRMVRIFDDGDMRAVWQRTLEALT